VLGNTFGVLGNAFGVLGNTRQGARQCKAGPSVTQGGVPVSWSTCGAGSKAHRVAKRCYREGVATSGTVWTVGNEKHTIESLFMGFDYHINDSSSVQPDTAGPCEHL
jgi:hypothetical protein